MTEIIFVCATIDIKCIFIHKNTRWLIFKVIFIDFLPSLLPDEINLKPTLTKAAEVYASSRSRDKIDQWVYCK